MYTANKNLWDKFKKKNLQHHTGLGFFEFQVRFCDSLIVIRIIYKRLGIHSRQRNILSNGGLLF